eukprot:gnl/Chilomastix_cuspidata/9819.p2 GENE.gnl/Chilomastix_cuspidata/9819~~gnl/Chilomastix_cuspidata/9819.p2  ORF type:complete len:128 (-),score=4.89 gnl/Chilomastix_cuspidata/9819:235-618(-)
MMLLLDFTCISKIIMGKQYSLWVTCCARGKIHGRIVFTGYFNRIKNFFIFCAFKHLIKMNGIFRHYIFWTCENKNCFSIIKQVFYFVNSLNKSFIKKYCLCFNKVKTVSDCLCHKPEVKRNSKSACF